VVSGFYMDRPHLDEWYGETLGALERSAASRRAVFSTWCRAGVGYAVFDRGSGSLDDLARKDVRPLAAFRWTAAPGLAPRLLFSARGVDVLAVHPCAAVSWPDHTAVAGAPAPVPGSATRGAGRATRGGSA
jgi:alkylhydroperoxidase family enzyme